jgi:cytochrome bd-type quinol oxidase subunit 2
MIEFFQAGGFVMFPLLALAIALVITGVQFARNADAQRLSLIRALTTATVFCALVGVAAGLGATCKYVITEPEAQREPLRFLLLGFAETMTIPILGGGGITLAWILVAFGIRRMPQENP